MTNFTSNTYTLKREILSFSNKISRKINIVDRLSRHLAKGTPPPNTLNAYLTQVRKWCPKPQCLPIIISQITFSAMERSCALFGRATFVMNRGYDDNKIFLKLDFSGQDYVILLTAKRKQLYHNK